MKRFGFTLIELVIVILVLGVLLAFLIPWSTCSHRNARITNCGSNLSQLTKSMYNYSITKCPVEGSFPTGPGYTGGAFWTTLYSTKVIDDPKVLICPVMAATPANGTNTDYRGPRKDPYVLPASGALGCDKPGNHGSDPKVPMNWVARSGDVHKIPADTARWAEVLNQTSD